MYISALQQQILETLGRFGYATTDQLISLGIGKDRSYINKLLKKLRTDYAKPLVYSNHFGVHPKKGRLPSVHSLSKYGAKILHEELEWSWNAIRFTPIPQKLFQNDYEHRLACIQIHMKCYKRSQTSGYQLLSYHHYFEKRKKSIHGSTTALTSFAVGETKRLIADSIFLLKTKDITSVFALEYYNDKTVLRMYKQLEKYIQGLSHGYPSLDFGIEKNATVLLVFKYRRVMELLMERVLQQEEFSPFKKLFLFKSFEQINTEVFSDSWELYDSTKTILAL